MAAVTEGTLLWEPPAELVEHSRMREYMAWLQEQHGLTFGTYAELWDWSVSNVDHFWRSMWDYFHVQSSQPYSAVLARRGMPGAGWFPGATLNYAEHVFRNASAERPAIIFQSELQPLTEISWDALRDQVASLASALRNMGVGRGDRVVAYLPNIPQAVIALLATASLGAIWSSCSPDFGTDSVVDRFSQIEPKVLFTIDGYQYGGKAYDRMPAVVELQEQLPTLQHTILVPYLNRNVQADGLKRAVLWERVTTLNAPITFEPVPFDHPLWVLYSSGTTGLPKPIVQGQGGILLEHLKSLALHLDLRPDDRFFWFTTTGWMMWNFLVGGLLVGCSILLYDGSPAYPTMDGLWEFAERSGMTCYGTSAAYITACMKAGIQPGKKFNLSKIKSLGSTGSPLSPEGFSWLYEHVGPHLWVVSTSGGTDVCTSFVTGCPLLPVHAGEIQCRALGARVEAYDEQGRPVIDAVGELVVTEPMPSMPLFFWDDPGMSRYRESYFEMFPGIWRHGDWIKITPRGSAVIYGRSDSTINRMGIRMGTSELYRVVESIPEVLDSLVIDLEGLGGAPYMPLFVVLRPGAELDERLRLTIASKIRTSISPRHVPDEIFRIPEVPRTLNGKKLEVPVKRILRGTPVERAVNPDSMSNPQALRYFVGMAEQLYERGIISRAEKASH